MSCKYNNHLYTTNPPEEEVCFDAFEELLLTEDYETPEERNYRLNREYGESGVHFMNDDEMLEFSHICEEYYNRGK